jgi:ABC-type sulfate/molybdate transport systems ATPase subunit
MADPVGMKTTRVSPGEAPIAVEGLTKRYGKVQAVDDPSFAIRPGAVTGFLGPNGAGKTTALKMIVGLARPTAGRALISGNPVGSAAADARMLGVYIEPTGALDPQGIRWLRTFLRKRAAGGGTVLLSSHVLSEAAQTVDDVVVIHKGRLVRQGSIDELAQLGGGGVIAGLHFWLILFGLVGAAGEYRHRTAAPAALAAGGRRGRVLLARAAAYASPASCSGRSRPRSRSYSASRS